MIGILCNVKPLREERVNRSWNVLVMESTGGFYSVQDSNHQFSSLCPVVAKGGRGFQFVRSWDEDIVKYQVKDYLNYEIN